MVSQVVTHAAGFPVKFLDTDEEKLTAAQYRNEAYAAAWHALIAGWALERIIQAYSPSQDDLRNYWANELIMNNEADAFARAILHFAAGDFDEAILVALPRIKAVLRRLLVQLGGVVYREPRGAQPGGVRTLGDILQALRGRIDEGWWRFLWVTLTEPLGLNLRNEYLHGLAEVGTRDHAALVIKVAAFLRLLELSRCTRKWCVLELGLYAVLPSSTCPRLAI